MAKHTINTRNEALEFARRARRNLEFIECAAAREADADVYVVTQLTLSLLGMVVFPKEKLLLKEVQRTSLSLLQNWPRWNITRDDPQQPTRTLGDLMKHVRNAVAHGRITFTSDSHQIEEVGILVEDKWKGEDAEPYWCAEIQAKDLKTFCLRFLDFIDNTIG